jgi:hypothetical protein
MRAIRTLAMGFVLLFGMASSAVTQTDRPHPLDQLKYRTAWLLLGAIDLDTGLWFTSLTHALKDAPRAIVVPRVNDVIEMTAEVQPVIIDYVNGGEELRQMSPAPRILCRLDFVDFKLPRGTLVRVKAISRGKPVNQLQEVWVRVEPVK